jgi:hypothetical protein
MYKDYKFERVLSIKLEKAFFMHDQHIDIIPYRDREECRQEQWSTLDRPVCSRCAPVAVFPRRTQY